MITSSKGKMRIRTGVSFLLAALFLIVGCKESVTFKDSPDPYSPLPGQPDAYEEARTDANCPTGLTRELGAGDNSTEYATCLNLNGTKQLHSFHSREDADWYIIYARASQRVIVETFDVSDGISTIVKVYYAGTDGSLTKVWGTDSGAVNGAWEGCDSSNNDTDGTNDYKLCEKPDGISYAPQPGDIAKLNKRVKFKRSPDTDSDSKEPWNSSPYAAAIYYVKVTIPPFSYQKGKAANYSIRARGSGDYFLATPTNVTATRDAYTNRIEVKWDLNGGATSYRVVRDTVSGGGTNYVTATCSSWPCNTTTGFSLSGSQKLILEKTLVSTSYTLRDDDTTSTTDCDTGTADNKAEACETTLKSITTSEEIYSDKGSWSIDNTLASPTNSNMRCNSSSSGSSINKYKWVGSSTGYQHALNTAFDATDINAVLPGILTPNTDSAWDNYVQADQCSSLPGDTDSSDDPKVGELYYYAVYACDDILEACTGPSSTTEQANSSYLAGGGGALKIKLETPQVQYVSDVNDNGIWITWNDITSNKSAASSNLRVRYSIQRATSPTGPFKEVECQIDTDSTASAGLLREFDGKADNSTLDPGRLYYYRVVAQQLRDGISCTGNNCSSTNARRGRGETGAGSVGTSANDDDGGDDSCSADSDYFVSTSVSESLPSNVVEGRMRFLANQAMCLRVNSTAAGASASMSLRNNLSDKKITISYYDPTQNSGSGKSYSASFSLSTSSGGAQQVSALCASINGYDIDGGDGSATISCSTTPGTCNGGTFNYGLVTAGNSFANAPATLLKDSGTTTNVLPINNGGTYTYGDEWRPVSLEDRALAEDGYENNQIKVRWAPVVVGSSGSKAGMYTIYRKKAEDTNANLVAVNYINIIYHGNAFTAKVKVTSNSLQTQLSGQTDNSQSLLVDFSNPQTDTIPEIISFLNSKDAPGYSAWVTAPQYKITDPTRLVQTASNDNNYLDLKVPQLDGKPKPVGLYAQVAGAAFPTDITPCQETPIANLLEGPDVPLGTGQYEYVDSDASLQEGKTYYYLVQAWDTATKWVSMGNWDAAANSPDLTGAAGAAGQYYKVSVAGSTTVNGESSWAVGDCLVSNGSAWVKNGFNANKSYNYIAAFGSKRPAALTGSPPGSFDYVGSGSVGQLPADNDQYEFQDYVIADNMQYALANNWDISGAGMTVTGYYYTQYQQKDNDRFVGTAPASSGDVFNLKLGTHIPHNFSTIDGWCSFHNVLVDVSHPTDHDGNYTTIGYDDKIRPATYLPASFHNPSGYSRWPGDPDIIYDNNSGTGGTEPANKVTLTLASELDEDWLWFFAQKKYYTFSQYNDYSFEFGRYPGSGNPSSDEGCLSTTHSGPFPVIFSAMDTQRDSRPCSYDLTSGLPSSNNNNGDTARAATFKKYIISYQNTAEGMTGPIILDIYYAWANLTTYHSGSGISGSFKITPDMKTAPLISSRVDPSGSFIIRLPSAANFKEYRGFGMVDFPSCDATPVGGINTTYSGGGPCVAYPVCQKDTDNVIFNGFFYFDQTNSGSSSCARIPTTGIKLCDTDSGSDNIYDSIADINGGKQACLPAPYYTGADFYNGNTCSSADKTQCPAPAGHFIMRVTSDTGKTGKFDITVTESSDTNLGFTFPE